MDQFLLVSLGTFRAKSSEIMPHGKSILNLPDLSAPLACHINLFHPSLPRHATLFVRDNRGAGGTPPGVSRLLGVMVADLPRLATHGAHNLNFPRRVLLSAWLALVLFAPATTAAHAS